MSTEADERPDEVTTGDSVQEQPEAVITFGDLVDAVKMAVTPPTKLKGPPPDSVVRIGPVGSGKYHPSPSLHELVIQSIDGYEEHSGYIASALDAFSTATVGLENLNKAREHVRRDPSKNEAAQILMVAGEAEKLQTRLLAKFDHAFRTISKSIAHVEGQLNAAMTSRADHTISREVREHVKGLNTADRADFMGDALKNNDLPTLEAVLGAQPFLSGLTRVEQARHLRQYRESAHPELAARLRVLQRALALVADRGPIVMIEVKRCLGADFATVARLKAANSDAEKALLLVNAVR